MNYDSKYYKCRGIASSDEENYEELKIDIKKLKKDRKELKEDNLLLKLRIEKLEKLINDMISYQPEGEGYQETKTHFGTIITK